MSDARPCSFHARRGLLGLLGLLALSALAGPAQASRESIAFARRLREGGCVVLIRHTQTEPGTGDPPGFRLDECRTQRLLSLAGQEDARAIGRWFKARRLEPREVFSSQWCRCKDTAELAFGRYTEWPALNSTFGDGSRQPAQTRELRERLQAIAAGEFEVWVTHQVNMTDLSNEYPSPGEAFLVGRDGRVQARLDFH